MADLLADTDASERCALIGRPRQQPALAPEHQQLVPVLVVREARPSAAGEEAAAVVGAHLRRTGQGHTLALGIVIFEQCFDGAEHLPAFGPVQPGPCGLDVVDLTVSLGVTAREQQPEALVAVPDIAHGERAALVVGAAELVVGSTERAPGTETFVVER